MDEWLAKGGQITRVRDEAEPIEDEYRGTKFEWVVQGSSMLPAVYRCQRTGVLAHKRSANNRITPYTCRHPRCSEYGRHRGYGNATYCDEHKQEGRWP